MPDETFRCLELSTELCWVEGLTNLKASSSWLTTPCTRRVGRIYLHTTSNCEVTQMDNVGNNCPLLTRSNRRVQLAARVYRRGRGHQHISKQTAAIAEGCSSRCVPGMVNIPIKSALDISASVTKVWWLRWHKICWEFREQCECAKDNSPGMHNGMAEFRSGNDSPTQ